MKRYAPLLLLFLFIGCNKTIYVTHPGSVDKLDSQTYDVLLTTQSVLETTKQMIKEGKLPPSVKPLLNNAGTAYNDLTLLWLDYHNKPLASKTEKIISATTILNNLILQLRGLGAN